MNNLVTIGAGVCKSFITTEKWLKVAPVVSGSYTPERRPGNTGTNLFYPETESDFLDKGYGLNSFGMPNVGFDKIIDEIIGKEFENPLTISVAAFSVEDYIYGLMRFNYVSSVSGIEFNFGCPNTEHGKIMSFDLKGIEDILSGIKLLDKKEISVKLSPYSDPGMLKEVAQVISKYSHYVNSVVTCNTFPNAFAGKNRITPNDGLAGLSGTALKHISLGQVVQFRKHLPDKINVVGIGGITTGNDIVDSLEAGAKSVQLTSMPFWLGDPGKFWPRLTEEDTGSRFLKLIQN